MAEATLDEMFLNRFEMPEMYKPDEVVFGPEGYSTVPVVTEEPISQGADTNIWQDIGNVVDEVMDGFATGTTKASVNMFEPIPFPWEGLTLENGTPVDNFALFGEWINQSTGTDFQIEPPDTMAGQAVEGVTQALIGILPTSRVLKAMGMGHRLTRDIISGGVGDFITSSEDEAKGYLKLMEKIPAVYGWDVAGEISNVTSEWMMDPYGEVDELKARVVASVPGIILAPVLDGFIALAGVAKGAGAAAGGNFTADVKMRFDKALEARGVGSYSELREQVARGEGQ